MVIPWDPWLLTEVDLSQRNLANQHNFSEVILGVDCHDFMHAAGFFVGTEKSCRKI